MNDKEMKTFSNRIIIITGAGSGIGRALAVGFCKDGANVFGIGRTYKDLLETQNLCHHGRMNFIPGDITKEPDVNRLVSETLEHFNRVDILINNAAIYPKKSFLEMTHAEWIDVMNINVNSLTLCCRKVLPHMMKQGFGRILNVGSFAWRHPIPNSSAYSATKGAVRAFTKALASEINRTTYPNLLINEWVPGSVKTRMSSTGEKPEDIYPHARHIVSLPEWGPTGQTFIQSELFVENNGIRASLKRLFAHLYKFLTSNVILSRHSK